MIVLQLDELLQLVQLALQISHAAFQFLVVTTGRVEVFLSDCQFVAQRLGVAGRAFCAGLGAFRRDEAQIVLGVGRCTGIATATIGRIQLLLTGARLAHITTALTPGFVLRRHFSDGCRLRQRCALYRVRQTQHLAGFQTVDIAVDKGIRIERLNRQHGLLHRAAVARLRGDFPQGVARRGGVLIAMGRASGWRSDGLRRRRLRGGVCGLRRELRRIEQHAVITQQAAIGPHHLHEELHHRFRQRLAGGHAQHAFAAGVEYRGERQVIEKSLTINASLGEIFRGSQARHHLGGGEILDVEQLDFSHQRLVQGRLQGQLPEPEGMRHTGGQRRGGRYC